MRLCSQNLFEQAEGDPASVKKWRGHLASSWMECFISIFGPLQPLSVLYAMSSGKYDQHDGIQMKAEPKHEMKLHFGHPNIPTRDTHVFTEMEANDLLSAPSPVVPYTVFTRVERRTITWLIGCSMFFSPFTANIYFPCLEQLQHAVGVNSSLINLTITTFLIVQAVAPAFFGDMADNLGRRPVYLVTFSVYVCANLALALQSDYAALMVLCGLQSLGCSATVAIGYGVVADIATPATRGSILGPAMIATNLGPSIGPLIGGVLAARTGWWGAFWLLVIIGTIFLAILAVVLPETGRKLVGNGSVAAAKWTRPLLLPRPPREQATRNGSDTRRKRNCFPNPFKAVFICFYLDTSVVLIISAVYYAVYYCIQASIPAIFTDIYNLNELQVGLCYLSIGTGVILGGYVNGRLMDANYSKIAELNHITVDKVIGDDLAKFPIQNARSRMSWSLISLSTAVTIGYAWVVQRGIHISVTLILLFLHGFLATCICQTHNTLIVDICPKNPSTAAAAGNIARCVVSAAAVAAMQPLLDSMGRGWFFTALALISGVLSAVATFLI
ncbi:major facilitator superfamily domain-containing protein [Pyrenochaeta sp. MPI-SDFR-AT-0127]|nr:major facilitator superfamily domain-containing protein [Pyrenochaeta sp. MPI-SDFR-AT-0127]